MASTKQKIAVWPMPELARVFPHDLPPNDAARQCARGLRMCGARGEYCAVQVAIRGEFHLRDVDVTVSSLRRGKTRLPEGAVQLRWAGLVPVAASQANCQGAERPELVPGWYPDPLHEPDNRARWSRTDWPCSTAIVLTLRIPRAAASGAYVGDISVMCQGNVAAQIPLRVEVWPFALPRKPSFHVTNWFQLDCLTKWHRCEAWSERHWKLIELYAATMHDYRQNVITTPVLTGNFHNSDPMTLVDTTRTKTGEYRFNFRRLGRWMELFDKYGFDLFEIWHFASAANGEVIPAFDLFDEKKGERVRIKPWPVLGAEYRRLLVPFLKQFTEWLDRRGLSHRVLLHVYDEPQPETWGHYAELAAFFREHAPGLRHMDAVSGSDLITRANADIDLPVPLTSHFLDDAYYKERARSGREPLWWYTCCSPMHPCANRFLTMPLLNTRILSWQAFTHGVTGYLHWGYNFWHRTRQNESGWPGISSMADHLLVNPYFEAPFNWSTGDACIVYPHPHWWEEHGPISSLRYEAHRAGLQDYELLRLLEQTADDTSKEEVRRQAKRLLAAVRGPVAGHLTQFCRDGRKLLRLRENIGQCIAAGC